MFCSSPYNIIRIIRSEVRCSYLGVALSFTAWTDSWLDLQFKSKPKYLLHHDTVALKKWYNGNLTSSAKQCKICHSLLPYVLWSLWLYLWTSKQSESWWINDGNHKARKHKLNLGCTKEFWLKTDTFWPEDLGLSVDISISFTLLDNWNGSLHLIKHKQNAKISYSFILYPVSSI